MRLGLVSTYAPRRHDLAGPTAEFARALTASVDLCVVAVDRYGLDYPDEVAGVIAEDDADDYRRAARILAEYGCDAVLVEYDDGLFGGPDGAHVLDLVHELRRRGVPYLVRLNAMGPPTHQGSRVVMTITAGAAGVVVPGAHAADRARRLTDAQVFVIPPGVAASTASSAGSVLPPGVAQAMDLLTARTEPTRLLTVLGPVAPDRGLEHTLHGFARILADHPDVRLLLAETTYPQSPLGQPDGYLDELWSVAHDLGVVDRMAVVAERLGAAERVRVLTRTDVLVMPWLPAGRPASRLLGEAQAAGCAVVATAHPYAVDVLAAGSGAVLDADDAQSLARAVGHFLDHPATMAAARAQAHATGWRFTWPAVAAQTVAAVEEALGGLGDLGGLAPAGAQPDIHVPVRLGDLHLEADGAEDHALLAVIASRLAGSATAPTVVGEWMASTEWARRALAGLTRPAAGATSPGWLLRGLAALSEPAIPPAVRDRARTALSGVVEARMDTLNCSLEDDALVVLAMRGKPVAGLWPAALTRLAAARSVSARGPAWPWFADRLRDGAARLPHALIVGGTASGDAELVSLGVQSLDWYLHRIGLGDLDGVLSLRTPAGESAVEAAAVVEALVDAYAATGSARYARLALRAFAWFGGINRYGEPAYDADLGRCRERIGPVLDCYPVCATLAYLAAAVALRSAGLVGLAAAGSVREELAAAA